MKPRNDATRAFIKGAVIGGGFLHGSKAWVNFDGTPAGPGLTTNDDFFITSVTKNGTGDYTIAFAETLGDIPNINVQSNANHYRVNSVTTSTVQVLTFDSAFVAADASYVSVTVHGR